MRWSPALLWKASPSEPNAVTRLVKSTRAEANTDMGAPSSRSSEDFASCAAPCAWGASAPSIKLSGLPSADPLPQVAARVNPSDRSPSACRQPTAPSVSSTSYVARCTAAPKAFNCTLFADDGPVTGWRLIAEPEGRAWTSQLNQGIRCTVTEFPTRACLPTVALTPATGVDEHAGRHCDNICA